MLKYLHGTLVFFIHLSNISLQDFFSFNKLAHSEIYISYQIILDICFRGIIVVRAHLHPKLRNHEFCLLRTETEELNTFEAFLCRSRSIPTIPLNHSNGVRRPIIATRLGHCWAPCLVTSWCFLPVIWYTYHWYRGITDIFWLLYSEAFMY